MEETRGWLAPECVPVPSLLRFHRELLAAQKQSQDGELEVLVQFPSFSAELTGWRWLFGISENQPGTPAKGPALTVLKFIIWSIRQQVSSSLILFLLGLSVWLCTVCEPKQQLL